MKEFTKGQTVIVARNWDNRGAWHWQRAKVHSCGQKRMTLEDFEGVCLGRNFPVKHEVSYEPVFGGYILKNVVYMNPTIIMKDVSDEEANAIVLEYAKNTLAFENARFEHLLKTNAHETGYCAAIKQEFEKLHDPEVVKD